MMLPKDKRQKKGKETRRNSRGDRGLYGRQPNNLLAATQTTRSGASVFINTLTKRLSTLS